MDLIDIVHEYNPRTLYLTVHAKAFEVMVTGEKDKEFRKPTAWIKSRLQTDKLPYTRIRFTNGYGADKPYFICKPGIMFTKNWKGIHTERYSNGLAVVVEADDIILYLGEIVERGNLKQLALPAAGLSLLQGNRSIPNANTP